MSNTMKVSGSAKVWTTSKWSGIERINHLISEGKADEAISALTYINQDMSSCEEWTEVGVAEITVTFYPRDTVVAKELEGLKAQLEKVRAENHMRENAILDRISKLQAIEYVEAEQ